MAGSYWTAFISSTWSTECFWHSGVRQTGGLSLTRLRSFLFLRLSILPWGLCVLFNIFLVQSLLILENFLLNSILSPNVIVPLCGQLRSMWLHLGPWDTSLGNGRFRTRQGIGTSAINSEKDNARFIWLLACDLWVCERSLNLLEDYDDRNVV